MDVFFKSVILFVFFDLVIYLIDLVMKKVI